MALVNNDNSIPELFGPTLGLLLEDLGELGDAVVRNRVFFIFLIWAATSHLLFQVILLYLVVGHQRHSFAIQVLLDGLLCLVIVCQEMAERW